MQIKTQTFLWSQEVAMYPLSVNPIPEVITILTSKTRRSEYPLWLSGLRNPTSIHATAGSILGLAQCIKDLAWLWLWCRPAASAPVQPLAWELPYAAGAALKRKKKNNPKPHRSFVLALALFVRGVTHSLLSAVGFSHSAHFEIRSGAVHVLGGKHNGSMSPFREEHVKPDFPLNVQCPYRSGCP